MELQQESPAIEELKQVVSTSRHLTYVRDAVLEHIRHKSVRVLARLFSHEICGPDGHIYLRNADYRSLLGVLHTAIQAKDSIDRRRSWAEGLRLLQEQFHPSTQSIVERLRVLVECADLKCGPKQRLADVRRLIEISYPLGTSLTDPDGGDGMFLPASGAIRVHPSNSSEVRSSIELVPDGDETVMHNMQWEFGVAVIDEHAMGNETFIAAGKTRRFTKFFGQEFGRSANIEPHANLGDDHPLPGWLIVVRSRDRIALLLKHIGSGRASSKETTMSNYGDVKTRLKARREVNDGTIVRVQYWEEPEERGAHFKYSSDVQYAFSTGERVVDKPFGATVRTPDASA